MEYITNLTNDNNSFPTMNYSFIDNYQSSFNGLTDFPSSLSSSESSSFSNIRQYSPINRLLTAASLIQDEENQLREEFDDLFLSNNNLDTINDFQQNQRNLSLLNRIQDNMLIEEQIEENDKEDEPLYILEENNIIRKPFELESEAFVNFISSINPKNSICDSSIYDILDIGGYDRNTQVWNDDLFFSRLGNLLGYFIYLRRDGSIINLVDDTFNQNEIYRVKFQPFELKQIAEKFQINYGICYEDLTKVNDIVQKLYTCLYNGNYPSELWKYDFVQKMKESELNINKTLNNIQVITEQGNLIENIPKFDLTPVAGDGLCLYRSLASNIVYRITGAPIRSDTKIEDTFIRKFYGGDIIPGQEVWRSIAFENPTVEGIVVSGIAYWIKFYISIIIASKIPSENISYYEGVTNIDSIIPLTNINDMLIDDIVDKINGIGLNKKRTGPFYLPTLDLIIRYSLWCIHAIKNTLGENPKFSNFRQYILPLFAVPLNLGPFLIPEILEKEKEYYYYDVIRERYIKTSFCQKYIQTEVFGELSSRRVDPISWNEFSQRYRLSLLRFVEFGGNFEIQIFSHLLRKANNIPFKTGIIYTSPGNNDIFVPNELRKIPLPNLIQQLTLAFSHSHYDSLLPKEFLTFNGLQLREYIFQKKNPPGIILFRRQVIKGEDARYNSDVLLREILGNDNPNKLKEIEFKQNFMKQVEILGINQEDANVVYTFYLNQLK